MNESVSIAILSGVLSGGLVSQGVAIWRAKKTTVAERDSIVVTSAEKAVLALTASLEAETHRADRAEAMLAEKDKRIAALEGRLDALQSALDDARRELWDIAHSSVEDVETNPYRGSV